MNSIEHTFDRIIYFIIKYIETQFQNATEYFQKVS